MNFLSFLRNGIPKKNKTSSITKNWDPPHEEIPNDTKTPPAISLKKDTLPLSDFMPLRNK